MQLFQYNPRCSRHMALWLAILCAAVMLDGCSHAPSLPSEGTTAPMSEATIPAEEAASVPTPTTPPETTAPPKICPLPLDDWRLQLVNREHPLENTTPPAMTVIRSNMQVDSRCYDDLKQMLSDCRAAGLNPLVCSAYRDMDCQNRLFECKIRSLLEEGMSEEDARTMAQTVVAPPGTSEHHLGLAVDIVDESYQELTELQEQTAVQQWLLQHCWEYGFILRYPNSKSDVTGIIYEPWHYRYVGREVAAEIFSSGLCLEEYLAQFQS